MNFGQNKMDDCLATCQAVCARATRHNSGNWPFLQAKACYIISAVYRQAKQFDVANEYMEKSSEVLVFVIGYKTVFFFLKGKIYAMMHFFCRKMLNVTVRAQLNKNELAIPFFLFAWSKK